MSDTDTMRARIASELNRSLTDSFGNGSETFATAVNREINSSIQHYEANRMRWNEVYANEFATTVDGTRSYSLPANFVVMDSLKIVYNGNYITLERRSNEWVEQRDSKQSALTGVPGKYTLYGNVARPFPVPNGAYTLVASFIKKELPTSITGSFTAVIPAAGSYSLTVTTTASHNNRTNGWFQDGEALIRSRTVAALEVHYLRKANAIREMQALAIRGMTYLSAREVAAFNSLNDKTHDMLSTGMIEPCEI